jgi:lipopolysaccharide export system permease protein
VLIAAICVSLAAAANREFVMPNIREHLATDSKNIGGDQAAIMQSRFDSETDILIGGEKIVPAQNKILKPAFVLPRQFDQFGKQLTAQEALYMPADGDRPSGYLLTNVSSPKALLRNPWLLMDNKPIIMTPVGSNWIGKDQIFVASGVAFEFLSAGANWSDFASTREMIKQLQSPSIDMGNDVRVVIHNRFLQPFLDTTLLFLGLPFVVTRTNRNPFISLGLCLAVVAVFMIVGLGCKQLGSGGWLTPAFAAWLPLMIFGPLAAAASDTLRQ